jgi:hypothetical protein
MDGKESQKKHKNTNFKLSNIVLNISNTNSVMTTPILVKQIISHPKYNYSDLIFDEGLIELAEPLNFTDKMQPVRLLQDCNQFTADQVYTVIGWGMDEEDRKSSLLQSVSITGANSTICAKGYFKYPQNKDQFLCAGFMSDKDTCQGDSGGPILMKAPGSSNNNNNSNNTNSNNSNLSHSWIQMCIANFDFNTINGKSTQCGAERSVSYYERSDFSIPWIASITRL